MNNLPSIVNNESNAELHLSKLRELSDCLEIVSAENPSVSISVLPNMIKDIAGYFQENKRLKYQNEQFKQKCSLIKDYTEKQYNLALYQIKNEFHAKLSQIKSGQEIEFLRINKEMEVRVAEIATSYRLEASKLYIDFQKFKDQMQLENKKLVLFAKQLGEQQKNHKRALDEMNSVCKILRKKIDNNAANDKDFDRYLLLMEMRLKYSCNPDIISIIADGLKG